MVKEVRVNGVKTAFDYIDPLMSVVLKPYMDAESFDVFYRAQLWKACGEDTGELCIQLDPEASEAGSMAVTQNRELPVAPPAPPAPLPENASYLARGRQAKVAQAISLALGAAEPRHRYLQVEVDYELYDPKTGLIWIHPGNSSGGQGTSPHCYTTYSHCGVDVDGPRCWFPCLDHPTKSCIVELFLTLRSAAIVDLKPIFSGTLLSEGPAPREQGRSEGMTYRFCTDTSTTARGVGLAVGPFYPVSDPHFPRFRGYYLPQSGYVGGQPDRKRARGTRSRRNPREEAARALHLTRGAVGFLEDLLMQEYPLLSANQVFVDGLPTLYAAFGGLVLLRSELLCDSKIPDVDCPGDPCMSAVEAVLLGWVQTALRLSNAVDRWMHHGVAGFLTDLFLEEHRGAEAAQHRLWRLHEAVVALDQQLGGPSIHPPNAEAYVIESMEYGILELCRTKGTLLMHMLEAYAKRDGLKLAIRSFLTPLSVTVTTAREEALTSPAAPVQIEPAPSPRETKDGESPPADERSMLDEIHSFPPPTPIDTRRFLDGVREASAIVGADAMEEFLNRWIVGTGIEVFKAGYSFIKRSRQVELVIKRIMPPWVDPQPCPSQLHIEVWEIEGRWNHVKQMPKNNDILTIPLPTHSKSRRRRKQSSKKKDDAPQEGKEDGEAGDSTTTGADGANDEQYYHQTLFEAQDQNTTAVQWVKLDPQYRWIRKIHMRKPEHQWIEQLFSDQQVEAQLDALIALAGLPLPGYPLNPAMLACRAIGECLRGRVAHTQEEHSPLVRAAAAEALAAWQNAHAPPTASVALSNNWPGLSLLIRFFAERFAQPLTGAPSEVSSGWGGGVLLPNWFDVESEYPLKKAAIWAIANVRAQNGVTPPEVCALLIDLLRNNDSTESDAIDDYYVAQIIVAAGQVVAVKDDLGGRSIDDLIAEVRRYLDVDTIRCSHNGVISACALQTLCELELLKGGRPETPYTNYVSRKYPAAVRIAAIQSIVRHYLSEDAAPPVPVGEEGEEITVAPRRIVEDNCDHAGFAAAFGWVVKLAAAEEDYRVAEGAITVLLDALHHRPPRAAHLARFQTADPLHGSCDPWSSHIFYKPRGGLATSVGTIYNRQPPRTFKGDAETARRLWNLMNTGAKFRQPFRVLLLQLWEEVWGWRTPKALELEGVSKPVGWAGPILESTVIRVVQSWNNYRPPFREAANRDALRFYYQEDPHVPTRVLEYYCPTVSQEQQRVKFVARGQEAGELIG